MGARGANFSRYTRAMVGAERENGWMRPRAWLLLICSVLTMALVGNSAIASEDAELRVAAGKQSIYADFPLWKDVRGSHFSKLRGGYLGTTRWAAYVSRVGASREARRLPCLTLAKISGGGVYGVGAGCGPLAPSGDQDRMPVYVLFGGAAASTGGSGVTEESFFSMSVSRHVRRLVLAFETSDGGFELERAPELLSLRKARKAGVTLFRFAAFALRQNVCLRHVTGYAGSGAKLLDSEVQECS